MKAPNITPGPWECAVSGDGEFLIFAEESFTGAAIIKTYCRKNANQQVSFQEAKANARAVTAIPQLLDALLDLVNNGQGAKAVERAKIALKQAGCKPD